MRRHIAGRTSAQATGSLLVVAHITSTGGLFDRGHGVLEGTPSREVLAGTDTTLDLLVFELVLHAALLAALLLRLLGLSLPVDAGTEGDVLADGGGLERGTGGVALLEAELGPRSPLGYLGVDMFADDGGLDAAGDLHFLVLIVQAVGNDGLGAVLVCDHLLRGERGRVVEFLVIGPVGTAVNLGRHG